MNTTDDGAQMAPGAPANGASSPTNPTNKPPARRRRAPNRRPKAENTSATAETQTEASAEAHAEPHVEPAPAASSEAQPSANGATESAGEQAEHKTARPRRARNTKSRRPAVELVRPPTPETPEETADEAAAPAGAIPETSTDVVDDGARPAASAPVEVPGEAAPTRRYRFQRPTRPAAQASAASTAQLRPERLSGRMAQPAPVEAESAPEVQAETPASVTVEPEESLESLLAGLGRRTPPPHATRLVWVIGDIWTRHTALSFVYTSRRDELSRFRDARPKGIIHRRGHADVAGGAKNIVCRRARPPLADELEGKERAGTMVIARRIAARVLCRDVAE